MCLCLAANATEPITHDFAAGFISWPELSPGVRNYHIGTMTADGTVYTCIGNATFALVNNNTQVGISVPSGDDVIVSPPFEGLQEMQIFSPGNANLNVYLSTDSVAWTQIIHGVNGSIQNSAPAIRVYNLDGGNYYVKIRNAGSATYITQIHYYVEPPTCNCFPYIP